MGALRRRRLFNRSADTPAPFGGADAVGSSTQKRIVTMSDTEKNAVGTESTVENETKAVPASEAEISPRQAEPQAPAEEAKTAEAAAKAPEAGRAAPEEKKPARRQRLTRDTPKEAQKAPASPQAKRPARARRRDASRPNRIEQVEVVITGEEGKPAEVELRPYRNTRVVRRGPDSRSKFVLKYSITLDTLPAQNLLERNFEHVSWSAEQLSNYIARNRSIADVAAFESTIDNESSKIDEKLTEGLMQFSGYLKDAGIDPSTFAKGSGWTRPVTFHLTIESNTAMRFVKLVNKFDKLCRILDVMHVCDQLGNGAASRHRSEVERWRNLVNSLARIVISSQHRANEMIAENRLPHATPEKNKPALTLAAEVAKEEEKGFARPAVPQLEMKAEETSEKPAEAAPAEASVAASDADAAGEAAEG